MVTVGVIAGVVERRLAAGRLRCPGCSGRLAGRGHARERVIRGQGGIGWRLRPRRSRCQGCGVTHVLLPVSCLLRRADDAAVIWASLTASAAGTGYRKIAAGLGCPASTVRGWLARFTSRAELVRGVFTMRLCALDPIRRRWHRRDQRRRTRWRRSPRLLLRPGAAGRGGWSACRRVSWPVR